MTVFPVIVRELRASARQPFTYSLRLLGVTALLVASAIFGLHVGFEPGFGRQLFAALHGALQAAIWVLVPLLTADCVSRERREGTLGLLFLTPLKGTDIIIAKSLAHGLRAVTLWVAVLPVLTIPFLIGGVSWSEATLSVLINANAMCWALAAGLLASAGSKAWVRALVLALILACIFLAVFATAVGWQVLSAMGRRLGADDFGLGQALGVGIAVITNAAGMSPLGIWTWTWGGLTVIPRVCAQTSALSLFALMVAVLVAGVEVRRSWREEPPSRLRLWLRKTFCTPVLWLSLFRRWMRHKLERNPIGWLEQRTWSGRLVTWGWFAVLVSIYSGALTDAQFFQRSNDLHQVLAFMLAGSMALSAAGSFRRERESGVLELLLVSPLGEGQIISGRLGGLWSQFLPAVGLLLGVWAYCSTFVHEGGSARACLFFVATFLTLPVFGLYFSLRCRNFLSASLATIVVGLVLPMILAEALRALRWAFSNANSDFAFSMGPSVGAAVCQGLMAMFCWNAMLLRLKRRAFPLERAQLS